MRQQSRTTASGGTRGSWLVLSERLFHLTVSKKRCLPRQQAKDAAAIKLSPYSAPAVSPEGTQDANRLPAIKPAAPAAAHKVYPEETQGRKAQGTGRRKAEVPSQG